MKKPNDHQTAQAINLHPRILRARQSLCDDAEMNIASFDERWSALYCTPWSGADLLLIGAVLCAVVAVAINFILWRQITRE